MFGSTARTNGTRSITSSSPRSRDAGERIKSAPGVRVVVLSGEGKSFCAGLDLAMFGNLGGDGETRGNPGVLTESGITHIGQQVAWVWQEVEVPVIAAVHGHALGGGLQIALGADIRFVHPDTQMSVREVYWGLVPDMTGTLFLSRLVGTDVAKELVFTARIFDGNEAKALGIATHLSEDPHKDAMALAAEIADRSPDAVRGAKRLINRLAVADAGDQFASERRGDRRPRRPAQPDRGGDGAHRATPTRLHRPRRDPSEC